MTKRTYDLEDKVIDWIDQVASNHPEMNKSELVNRCVKVYAAKVTQGEWDDPKFADKVDKKFNKMRL